MKPSRSPRFQSAAERRSIAATSACGSPSGILGAAHAATPIVATHHTPRTPCLFSSSRPNVLSMMAAATPERAAGAPARDGSRHPANAPANRRRGVLAALAARRLLPALCPLRLFLGFRARGLPLLGFLLRLLARGGLGLWGAHRLAHQPHRGRTRRRRRHRREHGLRHSRAGPAAFRHLHMLEHRIFPPQVMMRTYFWDGARRAPSPASGDNFA